MFRPFRLKRPIGPDSVMDRDDVLTTKRALDALGYLKAPDYGLTPYPDAPMIRAVKGFQRRHRLRVDGVMNPDGPTADVLGRVIAERRTREVTRNIREGEWDWLRGTRRPPRRYPGPIYRPEFPDRPRRTTIFDILAEVGLGRRNDPRDVLAARRALAWNGHLPRERVNDATGADLFGAVRAFQRASGLKADGWMGPRGETARALDNAIAPKVRAYELAKAGDADEAGAEKPGTRVAKLDKPPFPGMRGPEGAMINNPWLGGGGGAAIGTAIGLQELMRQQREKQGKEGEAPPASEGKYPRTDMAPPRPRLPGFEPPKDKDRLPTRTESPIQTVEIPDLSQPIPDIKEPTIFVHPMPPEDLAKAGTIIERKGNEETRKELERVRDHFIKAGWLHIGGGRYAADDPEVLNPNTKIKAGDERKEFHIPGHGKAFDADTRPGGHFTDLTFETPNGRIVHVQSVDVDRNGNPTAREHHVAERIIRAEKNVHVILIPKGAQLERVRRFHTQE